jgi:hypothetical protein
MRRAFGPLTEHVELGWTALLPLEGRSPHTLRKKRLNKSMGSGRTKVELFSTAG